MSVLKESSGSVGSSRGRARWQRALLVAELGFVVTLLVATALFVTSFVNVLRADLGFAPGRLIGVPVSRSFSSLEAARGPAGAAFVSEVLTRIAAVPGVAGVALVNGGLPLYGQMASYSIKVDGYGSAEGANMVVMKSVTQGFFDVAGVRMLGGRTFDASERVGTPLVAILNDEAARRFFGGRSPIGEVIQFRGPTTIVGVVSSVRLSGPEVPLRPEMYVPILQDGIRETSISGDLIVRLARPSADTSAAVVAALKEFNPPTRIVQARDLDQRFRELTADRRFNAVVMSVFGLLALAIAGAGVYGLTSFVVAQQFREIGLRLALGATSGRVFLGVLTDTGRLLALGVTLGLFGGWGTSRLFRSVIFGITGNEGWLYATVALTLALICLLAALLPAHRASRVDPLVALRSE